MFDNVFDIVVPFIILFLLLLIVVSCPWCFYLIFKAKTKTRKIWAAIGFMMLLFPVGGLIFHIICISGLHFHVATIQCGGNRNVDITVPCWNEKSKILFYQVREGQQNVFEHKVPLGILHSRDVNSLSFQLLTTADEDVIAITEHANPNIVLILHQFSTNWSWPERTTSWEEQERRAKHMLSTIQHNNPDIFLILAEGVTFIGEW